MLKNKLLEFRVWGLVIIFILIPIPSTYAAEQFSANYEIFYEVDQTGLTEVTENITLTNLTEKYYASSFNLSVDADKILEAQAFDLQGNLATSLISQDGKKHLRVSFDQQVAGKDKEYKWTLKFKSPDFAEKQGQIWQISIPKISPTSANDKYSLSLAVPLEFGDPTSITPEPVGHFERNGKIIFKFDNQQLTKSGILTYFGENQLMDFNLIYYLENNSFLPKLMNIALPPNRSFQKVAINSLNPKPENVTIDEDGNFLAWYKINRGESIKVSADGKVKLEFKSVRNTDKLSNQQIADLTAYQPFWEAETISIKAKNKEILNDDQTVKKKAKIINDFVASYLKYNLKRASDKNFERLGAVTALNNPNNALCLEFSDLFIAMTRAEKIPARELIGYSYTSNPTLRPLSFEGTTLHCFAEYFDPAEGWVLVDPTWQSTGNTDYFNTSDLNHFVLAIRGRSSINPITAKDMRIEFSNKNFDSSPNLSLKISSPSEIFAGFPAKLKVEVENIGNGVSPPTDLILSATNLELVNKAGVNLPALPPFGKFDYFIDIRPSGAWQSDKGWVLAKIGEKKVEKIILIKPFFSHKFFPYITGGTIALMIIIYSFVLYLHKKFKLKVIVDKKTHRLVEFKK